MGQKGIQIACVLGVAIACIFNLVIIHYLSDWDKIAVEAKERMDKEAAEAEKDAVDAEKTGDGYDRLKDVELAKVGNAIN